MFKPGYQNESIAYALAAGMVTFDTTDALDRNVERDRRRVRLQRASKGAR